MAQQPKIKSGMFTSGIIVTVVGAIIMLAGIWYGGSLANQGFQNIGAQAEDYARFDRGTGEIEIERGKFIQLYSTDETPAAVECEVLNPSGQNIVEPPKQRSSFMTGDERWSSFASFRTGSDGVYEVQCTSGPVTVAPAVSIAGVFMGAGGILIAVFTGIFGFLVLLVGVILWIIGGIIRGRSKREMQWQQGNGYPL